MPHHKSAKKRLQTSLIRRQRNRGNRAQLRSTIRAFRASAQKLGEEEKQRSLAEIYSLLDINARKGIIHKRKAARLKSRISALAAK